jgi:hypothetical protein
MFHQLAKTHASTSRSALTDSIQAKTLKIPRTLILLGRPVSERVFDESLVSIYLAVYFQPHRFISVH